MFIMDEKIEKYINTIIQAKWWKENLLWIPTDIIWFWDFGKELAVALEPLVTKKEICFFDLEIREYNDYHFLEFKDMFEKTELMIFTQELPENFLDDLSNLNIDVTIITDSNFKTTIEKLSANWFSKNLVII